MKAIRCAFLVFFAAATAAKADVVNLKNGDRVTGTMVNVKDGTLELNSPVLGDLKIPMAQVTSFSVEKTASVVPKGKPAVQGKVELTPKGDWQVTTDGKQQTIAAADVSLIMPADTYHNLVEHKAGILHDWKGNAGLGYSLQRGDQQTNTFSTTFTASRERPDTPIFQRHWRTSYSFATLLSHASQEQIGSPATTITSNTVSTSLRQDYLFTPANFFFGFGQIDHIGAQSLYLRQTYGGGFGHDLIHSSRTTFSLLGGLTYVHQHFFDGTYTQDGEGLLGEKLSFQLSKKVHLDHDINFYPNLTSTGQYRFDTATTLSAKLSNKFSLNTGVVDFYLSNPAAESRKNNIAFTTGIGYTF